MPRRGIIAPGLAAVLSALLAGAGGCSSGRMRGSFRAVSLGGNPVYLDADCHVAFYGDPKAPETSFVLSSVPIEELLSGTVTDGLIVHLDLLWLPAGGKTPMDLTATNASIRYIVFADGEVGVYGGAGFVLPASTPGEGSSTLTLWDASMSLEHSTKGFVDLLSPARLTGRFTARYDAQRALQMRREANKLVATALGRSVIVRLTPAPTWTSWSGPDGS